MPPLPAQPLYVSAAVSILVFCADQLPHPGREDLRLGHAICRPVAGACRRYRVLQNPVQLTEEERKTRCSRSCPASCTCRGSSGAGTSGAVPPTWFHAPWESERIVPPYLPRTAAGTSAPRDFVISKSTVGAAPAPCPTNIQTWRRSPSINQPVSSPPTAACRTSFRPHLRVQRPKPCRHDVAEAVERGLRYARPRKNRPIIVRILSNESIMHLYRRIKV